VGSGKGRKGEKGRGLVSVREGRLGIRHYVIRLWGAFLGGPGDEDIARIKTRLLACKQVQAPHI